jgi:hypothetical protein
LRLGRFVDEWDQEEYLGEPKNRSVCPDVSKLSRKELDKVLKKAKVDLSKTEDENE